MDLYTRDGKPLQVSGDIVCSQSGMPIGRIKEQKVFGTDGKYIGTIVGDRLVYRSSDSASIGTPFSTVAHAGTCRAYHAGSTIDGEEPDIPD